MCGIAGFFNFKKQNLELSEKLLQKMQRKISHRGPDDNGIWFSKAVGLGLTHARLSIVDLSNAAHQPMHDVQNSVIVSFNGEIYNHKDLRKELEFDGYKYFSKSDTETLLYAYKKWGIDFINKLEGDFAIALFDVVDNKFYLIRDKIGVKPVYYSLQNNILSFASEIKALFSLPWIKKEFSEKSVYDYLTFMVTPAPNTIYKDIFKLEAGTYLSIDGQSIEIKKYYSPLKNGFDNWILKQVQDDPAVALSSYGGHGKRSIRVLCHPELVSGSSNNNFNDENFVLENIDNLLNKSISKRMMSDVPVGAFLSGGLDSSLNVALMSKHSQNIKTFTVGFEDTPELEELKYARKVSKIFNTEHHEIIITECDAFEFYESMVYQLDEPLADSVCVPFYFVSKLAKENGIKVVQVGEGADELFFGYSTYLLYKNFYDSYWKNSIKYIPDFGKNIIYKVAKKLFAQNSNHLEILYNWANNRNLFWSGAVSFNEHQKKIIFDNKNLDSFNIIKKYLLDLDFNTDFIKQMTYLELKLRLPELLLMRADKMSMLNGLEARVPFLDEKLVEFMLNVPEALKIKNNQTKYLLKKVAQKYLPDEIIYRKKVGFASPIERWFKTGKYFKKYYKDLLNKELDRKKLFMPVIKNLEKVYNHHDSGFAVQKWTLQNFLALKNLNN